MVLLLTRTIATFCVFIDTQNITYKISRENVCSLLIICKTHKTFLLCNFCHLWYLTVVIEYCVCLYVLKTPWMLDIEVHSYLHCNHKHCLILIQHMHKIKQCNNTWLLLYELIYIHTSSFSLVSIFVLN